MAAGKKAIYYALLANFGIAITKTVASIITGSTSMRAEAVHSFADCGNQLLLLLGMKRAALPASELHPMGYGRVSYFWSFIVALMLFSMGGVFSLYEGFHKLTEPEPLKFAWVAVGVLTIGILLESFSLYGALHETRTERGSRSVFRWVRETRQTETMVIIGEDVAALLGLVIALFFVVLTMVTGNPVFDALGSMAIGTLLIVIAVWMAIEIKSLIIGESASDEFKQEFKKFLANHYPHVEVLHLITQHHGPDIMLAIKAKFMKWPASARQLILEINTIEKALRKEYPVVRFVFFEPDISPQEKQLDRERAAKKSKKTKKAPARTKAGK